MQPAVSSSVPAVPPGRQALAAVTAEAARFQAEGSQPGIAFGVVAGGQLVHSGGFGARRHGAARGAGNSAHRVAGTPDADTGFRIASMTKSFTAAAVLLLRDEGALRLDDPAADHIPAMAGLRGPTADSPVITVRHLLTMVAGFPTDDPWGDRQQGLPLDAFADLVRRGLSFAWAPGTAFEYSNLGYALLGLLVEHCSGASYRDFVTSRLLEPLGMASTGYDASVLPATQLATGHRLGDDGWRPVPYDPHGAFAPMGGLFSTVRDLARWIAGFTEAFPPRDDPEGPHPLCRASRRELQQPHRGLPPQLLWPSVDVVPAVRATGYGFGLQVEHDPVHGMIVGHSGGYPGFGSHMRWHPQTGLGVVVLGNATYCGAYRPAARMLSVLLAGAAPSPGPPRRSRQAGEQAATGTGEGTSPGPLATAPQPAPADEGLWAATRQARQAVERLLRSWDDELAATLFAPNVDLDRSLARRRAELELVRHRLGPLEPDPTGPIDQPSPAQYAWWLRGPRGRVRLEILLTPQLPPQVQTLCVTLAPDPSPGLRAAAELVVAQLSQQCPQWPQELATSMELDRIELGRLLRVSAAWAGACDIVGVTEGDGETHATFQLAGERADLSLTLTLDPVAAPTPAVDGATPATDGETWAVCQLRLAVET
jgi:CubicO group peptidase (beta-lactamase class C family)